MVKMVGTAAFFAFVTTASADEVSSEVGCGVDGTWFSAEGNLVMHNKDGICEELKPDLPIVPSKKTDPVHKAPQGPFTFSAGGNLLWVADEKTGQVRVCIARKSTSAPKCSPWSAPVE